MLHLPSFTYSLTLTCCLAPSCKTSDPGATKNPGDTESSTNHSTQMPNSWAPPGPPTPQKPPLPLRGLNQPLPKPFWMPEVHGINLPSHLGVTTSANEQGEEEMEISTPTAVKRLLHVTVDPEVGEAQTSELGGDLRKKVCAVCVCSHVSAHLIQTRSMNAHGSPVHTVCVSRGWVSMCVCRCLARFLVFCRRAS